MQPPDWAAAAFGTVDDVFACFDEQDSGCVSWGVVLDGQRRFLKTATGAGEAGLLRAAGVHRLVQHPALVPMLEIRAGASGTVALYPWVEGELLYPSDGPAAWRFRTLPEAQRLEALAALMDAHVVLEAAGFVSADLYDGCWLYDFGARALHVIDLDEYRPGPFLVPGERLPGSKRFMAPEEWQAGARIDHRTTVFHLGRSAVAMGLEALPWVARAIDPDASLRWPTVAALASA